MLAFVSGSIIVIIQSLVGTGSSSSFAAICFLTAKPTPTSLLLSWLPAPKENVPMIFQAVIS